MAVTRLTDVIVPARFANAVVQRLSTASVIRNSGIVTANPQMNLLASGPGNVMTMPFWNRISGASNVSSDDPAQTATPNKITQGSVTARKIMRNNAWSSADLVAAMLADDPIEVIRDQIVGYWVREEQTVLLQVMNGIFAAASMSGNILSVASESTAGAVNFDATVSANAEYLLGDQAGQLTAYLMHSRVYQNLKAQSAIVYNQNPAGTDLGFGTYDGKSVLVDDACPRVAGTTSGFKYTTYLFGRGAIGYAEATGAGGPKTPIAIERAEGGGNGEGIETLWSRRHWVMSAMGVSFSGNPAAASPTNAELALGTNWTRVYDVKNVALVAVITNG